MVGPPNRASSTMEETYPAIASSVRVRLMNPGPANRNIRQPGVMPDLLDHRSGDLARVTAGLARSRQGPVH